MEQSTQLFISCHVELVNLLYLQPHYVLTAGAPSATISFTSRLDGSYILYCTITGAPPPDITWQTSSGGNTSTSLFNSSLSHTLIPVRTFLLELTTTNDLLDYTCTATSVFNGMTWTANDSILLNTGNLHHNSVSLIIMCDVSFSRASTVVFSSGPIVEVVHGSHVTVTCMAQGRPIPSFTWYHNGMAWIRWHFSSEHFECWWWPYHLTVTIENAS